MSKFNSKLDEYIYETICLGFSNDMIGDVGYCAFQASVWTRPPGNENGDLFAILTEDSQGFVVVDYFDSQEDWEKAWSDVLREHDEKACCAVREPVEWPELLFQEPA